jgi:hypothetical protein
MRGTSAGPALPDLPHNARQYFLALGDAFMAAVRGKSRGVL